VPGTTRNLAATHHVSGIEHSHYETRRSVSVDPRSQYFLLMSSPAPGRPRDTAVTARILQRCWEVIATGGIDAVDIEALAAEIGCAKTTVYRRWPTKNDLIVAAIEDGLEFGGDPSTGDVTEDLVEFAMVNVRNHSRRFSAFALAGHSDVTRSLWHRIFAARKSVALGIMTRGIERGQLPTDTDSIAVIDLLSGFVSFRLVARAAVERDVVITREQLVRIVSAIVASPPRIQR